MAEEKHFNEWIKLKKEIAVLVFKKLSRYGFMGIPLTPQEHNGSWYISFIFQNKKQTAALAQARVISVARLYKRMGTLPNSDFKLVKAGFGKLYLDLE